MRICTIFSSSIHLLKAIKVVSAIVNQWQRIWLAIVYEVGRQVLGGIFSGVVRLDCKADLVQLFENSPYRFSEWLHHFATPPVAKESSFSLTSIHFVVTCFELSYSDRGKMRYQNSFISHFCIGEAVEYC